MTRAFAVLLSTLAAVHPLLCHVGATPIDSGAGTSGQAVLGVDNHHHHHDLPVDDTATTIALPNTATSSPPSWFESTLLARRLLALSRTGSISSTFPATHALAGLPIALPEYIADCADDHGNPTLLALPVSTTVRNAAAGSNLSLSLDWWSHVATAPPVFPGFPLSEAGLPRVTLLGYLEELDLGKEGEGEEDAVRRCFLEAHPDASAWVPGKKGSPHESYWARLVVEGVYWVGGFGGLQRIGWIDLDLWRGVRRVGSGGGDERGWGDVRLPGE